MEINSLRWSSNLFSRDGSRTGKGEKMPLQAPREDQIFHVPDDQVPVSNFSSITPRDLRQLAFTGYQSGSIDQETYMALMEELPSHSVDARGDLVDLSDITDATDFDFHGYYRSQLDVALSLGNDHRAAVLTSVLAFLEV